MEVTKGNAKEHPATKEHPTVAGVFIGSERIFHQVIEVKVRLRRFLSGLHGDEHVEPKPEPQDLSGNPIIRSYDFQSKTEDDIRYIQDTISEIEHVIGLDKLRP